MVLVGSKIATIGFMGPQTPLRPRKLERSTGKKWELPKSISENPNTKSEKFQRKVARSALDSLAKFEANRTSDLGARSL